MMNIDDILTEIDNELITKNKVFLTIASANQLLIEKGIFTTEDIKNKTLKKFLETNQIPNASQTLHAPRQWRIALSRKGLIDQNKKVKVVKRRRDVRKISKPVYQPDIKKVVCPVCNSILDVHADIINSPDLKCPLCSNNFKNPFVESVSTNPANQKIRALATIIILVVGIIAVIINNTSDSSSYSSPSSYSNPSSFSNSSSIYDKENELLKLKMDVSDLYNYLLSFKDNNDFHLYGFNMGYKYNKWLKDIENIENTSRQKQLFIPGVSIGDLKMLGLEYIKTQGKENTYTKWVRERLVNGLQ